MGDITIKDVAREANVSIATVSRVINKNYVVSSDLEMKVISAIEKLNYVPNSIARSLKNDNTHTIGLIVSDISNGFFTTIARAAEDLLMHKGYNLIVCSTDNQQEKEASYLQLLMEKKVDGIILNTTGENTQFISAISKNIPIALCSRKVESPLFKGDFVESDNIPGSYELTSHLLQLGHRRIAVINGQPNVSSSQERLQGFTQAMETVGITVDKSYPYLFNGNFSEVSTGYDGIAKLMQMEEPPTAVIAMNNELAIGVLKYCHTNNVLIPETLSVCAFGGIENMDILYVQPSYVSVVPAGIGRRLAELLIERIEQKNNLPNREIRFTTQLIEGNGVRAI